MPKCFAEALFAASLLFCISAANAGSYNAVSDFSVKSNPNGVWSYVDANALLVSTGTGLGLSGWLTPVLGFGNEGVFQNITGASLTWPPNSLPGLPVAIVPTDHLYLSTSINNTVLRFNAPASGTYMITGDFLGIDTVPVAHNVAVLVNGNNIFSANIAAYTQSAPFNFGKALNAGDTVDFINYGLSNIAYAYGLATGLAVNINSAGPPTVATAISASGFGAFPNIAPGTFIEIYGSNLSLTTRGWNGNDFTGVNAPTSLDGTSVKIAGKPAFVNFISPLQVNVLVSSDVPLGFQPLTVTTAVGTSATYNVMVRAVEPGLLAPSNFNLNGNQNAVALYVDGTFVLPTGAINGLNSRPAKLGDVITLYGIGFGPLTPDTPAGQLSQRSTSLTNFQISIGGVPATVLYAGLAPGFTGLYQFNIQVPSVASGNAVLLAFSVAGVAGTQSLYLAIGN